MTSAVVIRSHASSTPATSTSSASKRSTTPILDLERTPAVVIRSPATPTSSTSKRSATPILDIELLIAEESEMTIPYIPAQPINLYSPNQWEKLKNQENKFKLF